MGSRFAEMRLGPVILALFVLCSGLRPPMDPLANPRLMQGLLIGALLVDHSGGPVAALARLGAAMQNSGQRTLPPLEIPIDLIDYNHNLKSRMPQP